MTQPDPSQEQLTRLLAGVEFFADLSQEDLERLAEGTYGAVIPEGKVVFEEGEIGHSFYIVFAGSVEIVKAGPDGSYERLAVKREGEGFGEMALLNDAPRSALARTLEDTQLIVLPQKAFLGLVGNDPVALRLLRSFSRALRSLNVRFAALERTLAESAGATPSPAEPPTEPRPDRIPEAAVSGSSDGELQVSREMVKGMIPAAPPEVAGFDLAGYTNLAEEGRGQTTWDVLNTPMGPALAILEVRQTGLPPAHVLGLARTALRASASGAGSLPTLLAWANDTLVDSLPEDCGQSVDCALLLPVDGGVRWSCAGQVNGAVIRDGGQVETFRSQGPDLGVMQGFSYAEEELSLETGDGALFLSVESPGLFRGATDLVKQIHGTAAEPVVSMVQQAIQKAQGQAVQDVSAVYVRRVS